MGTRGSGLAGGMGATRSHWRRGDGHPRECTGEGQAWLLFLGLLVAAPALATPHPASLPSAAMGKSVSSHCWKQM